MDEFVGSISLIMVVWFVVVIIDVWMKPEK
jgi:hypothetical protein